MNKILAIVAGEPNSISSEIIFKSWMKRKKFKHKPFFIIGSINLLSMQLKKLKYKIKIKKINDNFNLKNLNTNFLPVYDIYYHQKKPFQKISKVSNKYIFDCFNVAINLLKKNKICGLVNCPVSKEHLLKVKYKGITDFLADKFGSKGNEVMLIFNKKLSVSPITTHIPLRRVSNELNSSKIIKKIKVIDSFYKKIMKKKPIIGILGLNPHNYSAHKINEEKRVVLPVIKILKKKSLKIVGPLSPDSSFAMRKKYNLNVIIGMYHDQVLTTFKSLFGYDAVNITLGLPFLRTSPDHGIASDMVGKKIANPKSLIEAIKFFNYIK